MRVRQTCWGMDMLPETDLGDRRGDWREVMGRNEKRMREGVRAEVGREGGFP